MERGSLTFKILTGATAAMVVATLVRVFLFTPEATENAGGLAQKIFYFHVPCAYAMYLSGVVCLYGSAAYLWKETENRNALAAASAECAAAFGLCVLTTGPLWAKKAWGVYWTWEPQLTASLLTVTLYVAIVVVRTFTGDGGAERRAAAAVGVIAAFLLPIIHVSVKLWGGNHPLVTREGGQGLHPSMRPALMMGFLTLTFFAVLVIWLRTRSAALKAQVRYLEEEAAAAGHLD